MMPALVPRLPFAEEPLLLDELNHRINNEFASLIGVVSHAAARSTDEEVKRALSGVAQLLHSHAEVHQVLQVPNDDALVDAAEYLGKLCVAISRSKLDDMGINLVLSAPPLLLSSGRCWRMGMIVSELITNAARHAFDGRRGTIRVELLRAGAFIKCSVADNGAAPVRIQAGRGIRIVNDLSNSLDGRFERKFGPGGSISALIFPCGDQNTEVATETRPAAREQLSGTDHARASDLEHASEPQWRCRSKTTR
jgi:two-component sensor histidine kinase